jgi:hypothetical protein
MTDLLVAPPPLQAALTWGLGARGVLNTTDRSAPDYVRPEQVIARPDLQLIHDLLGGTRTMWARSDAYITKWNDEADSTWERRRTCETLFEGFARTLEAAVGMLFSKAPTVLFQRENDPLAQHWASIDGFGTAGHVFARDFAQDVAAYGMGVIAVDFPSAAPRDRVITLADEQELGLRPRWAWYGRSRVRNWRYTTVRGQRVLSLLVLHEPAEAQDGAYGTRLVDTMRVLELVNGVATWRVQERRENTNTWEVIASGIFRNRRGQTRDTLPVVVCYARKPSAPFVVHPPLIGAAYANLSHWQLSSVLRFTAELTAYEQLVIVGELIGNELPDGTRIPGKLRIGPLTTVQVQQGGSAAWVGPSGKGAEILGTLVRTKLQEIAQQGLSFLQTDTRAAETAEAKRLDSSAENASLATLAQRLDDSLNTAWSLHAWFEGLDEAQAPVVTLSRDYESTGMPPELMRAWVDAVTKAGLPVRLLLTAMQARGLIASDVDLDQIEAEMLAERAAQHASDADREAAMRDTMTDSLNNPDSQE